MECLGHQVWLCLGNVQPGGFLAPAGNRFLHLLQHIDCWPPGRSKDRNLAGRLRVVHRKRQFRSINRRIEVVSGRQPDTVFIDKKPVVAKARTMAAEEYNVPRDSRGNR